MDPIAVISSARRLPMRRYFWLPLGLSAILVVLVLAGLVAMSWRGLDRLHPMQEHMAHITLIQDLGLSMEQTLLKGLRGVQVNQGEIDDLRNKMIEIAGQGGALQPQTRQRLVEIARRVEASPASPIDGLFEILAQVRTVLADERRQHDGLLKDASVSAMTELRLAVILLVALPISGGIGLWLLQRRTEQPLREMQDLLDRLSRKDFRPLPEETLNATTRLARPAFNSYNALVSRLRELEAEHQDREQVLEQRVRAATEALLSQSRELSRTERLAAVGAVSAGLAHELRNPLAGIQLACSKLQKQLADAEQANRISAVISELKRINHLLTAQVDAARHAPESLVVVAVGKVVNDLLVLLRYQVSAGIRLEAKIDDNLRCLLPPSALRQALLNLLLNAVQILADAGHIEIAAGLEQDRLAIRVMDDGPGFPQDMLQAGIRPFATGRSGGTGLGLAMVRRFVRDLDGEMKLQNLSPNGAQVTLHLPCRGANEAGGEADA